MKAKLKFDKCEGGKVGGGGGGEDGEEEAGYRLGNIMNNGLGILHPP